MSPNSATAAPKRLQTAEERSARIAVTVFPLLILAGGAVALFFPDPFTGLSGYVNPALMLIMFGMGLTLTLPDFALVVRQPLPVLLGVVAQYVVMPLLGLAVAWALQLSPELAAGVILVGCAPGGTASNVVTYLARGNVALSVAMTSVSTLLAPIFTPLLALWLAGRYMSVDAGSMALSIVQIVLIPVVLGLVIRYVMPQLVDRVLPALPWISVIAITFVVVAVVSGSAAAIFTAGWLILLAVILHNGLGLGLGYGVAKLFRQPLAARRTMAIEVGMQNSGLAAGLARDYFTPEAALPAAVFSVWHNVSGALMAAFWRRRPSG
ncbi:bile acid:sodium symporter family protein [Arthrobacter sp. zg-Y820]|uniref:bile acid:sodium symporter family protein n=1 Tax=unclassified Arthrobacter TaxID=235627 RepID=UPI001E447603|nr:MULTISPECIES: bile acid:sodium symporter family protein [unclassified Arthrobacter]MCC9197600.1 bile acid:sodium symporter family protein [Arthrobacter sp. zg-Y820]MDK1280467.1 bile acid:sodium symporter family protein [Arthrobacter sp. zg.Y820]MDK1361983.1 bile acid:sodium symporter family protein [Arthrobacter sp. zg-Y1219]WIB10891.1 bile acid:sodium symporter family protein [Arthrobacter sp. zg-Y820]